MSSCRDYFRSFTDQRIFRILIIDGLFVALFYFLFSRFFEVVNRRAEVLGGGQSVEQLQQLMLNNPESAQVLLSGLKSFLLLFIGGGLILLVAVVLTYSLTRSYLWTFLTGKPWTFRPSWKWNLLVLTLLVPLIIFLLIFLIIKLLTTQLFTFVFTSGVYPLFQFLNQFVVAISFLWWVLFVSLVYYSFTRERKIWHSIGQAFSLMKKEFWIVFTFSLLTVILLSLLLIPFQNYFLLYPQRGLIAQGIVLLLFLAWMRVYLVRTLNKEIST